MNWYQELRPWAVRLGQTPVGNEAGTRWYWWLAGHLAESWTARQDVQRVGIRGGMLDRIRVGVSDMDVTIHLAHLTGEGLESWRELYLTARNRWGLLGEPILATPTVWKRFQSNHPATLHWYEKHRYWQAGEWVEQRMDLPPLHPGSRFAFAWDWFRTASKGDHRWLRQGDAIARAGSRRTLEKLARYLALPEPTDLRHAWMALHALSTTVPPDSETTPVRRPVRPLDPMSEALRSHFNGKTRVGAEPTSVPLVWKIPAEPEIFVKFNHWRRHTPKAPPIYFVTSEMQRVLQQGWCTWWPHQPLPSLDWWQRRPRFGLQTRQSIRERLANDCLSLPGRYLGSTPSGFRRELSRVATEAAHLFLGDFRCGPLQPGRLPSPERKQIQRIVDPNRCAATSTVELVQWIRDELLCVTD